MPYLWPRSLRRATEGYVFLRLFWTHRLNRVTVSTRLTKNNVSRANLPFRYLCSQQYYVRKARYRNFSHGIKSLSRYVLPPPRERGLARSRPISLGDLRSRQQRPSFLFLHLRPESQCGGTRVAGEPYDLSPAQAASLLTVNLAGKSQHF